MTSVSVKGRRDERMPRHWSQYASISMEEGSYEAGLSNFETLRCPGYVPAEHYIQQFVYLSLVPTVKAGAAASKVKRRGRPKKVEKAETAQTVQTDDIVVFDEKMASSALTLLTRLLEMQAGTVFIEEEEHSRGQNEQHDHLEFIVKALPSYRRASSTAEFLGDTLLEMGAAQIDRCDCVWDVLSMKSGMTVDQDAWGVLDWIVKVWETQASRNEHSVATHLTHNLRDPKYDASSALDAVLAGFAPPTKLSPLSCSPSVDSRMKQDTQENADLLAAKLASESLQRRHIATRLLRLILHLVHSNTLNSSALKTHLGSRLASMDCSQACDVINAFPVDGTDVMMDVIVAIIQARGERVDSSKPTIMQILQSLLVPEYKCIALRNAIVGKSPSLETVKSIRNELNKSGDYNINLLLSLL